MFHQGTKVEGHVTRSDRETTRNEKHLIPNECVVRVRETDKT